MHIRELHKSSVGLTFNFYTHLFASDLHETYIKLVIFHFVKGHHSGNNSPVKVGWWCDFRQNFTREISHIVTSVWPPQLPRAFITGTHRTLLFASFVIWTDIRQSEERAPCISHWHVNQTFPPQTTADPPPLCLLFELRVADSSCCRGYIDMGGNRFAPPPSDSSPSRTALHIITQQQAAQRGEALEMKSPALFGAPVWGIDSISDSVLDSQTAAKWEQRSLHTARTA